MAEIVLFHHIQGLTPGVASFADTLRGAGHTVHTPDLFDGRLFDSIEAGQSFLGEVGFDAIVERAVASVEQLPAEIGYAGFSLGVVPAQRLAQTRPGAQSALLFHSCVPTAFFGPWPDGLPAQIHAMDADPYFVDEGDIDAARALVDTVASVELFLYPGSEHLFVDSSLPSYDATAAALLTERVLEFLDAH